MASVCRLEEPRHGVVDGPGLELAAGQVRLDGRKLLESGVEVPEGGAGCQDGRFHGQMLVQHLVYVEI